MNIRKLVSLPNIIKSCFSFAASPTKYNNTNVKIDDTIKILDVELNFIFFCLKLAHKLQSFLQAYLRKA